jgi:hypothetical protein
MLPEIIAFETIGIRAAFDAGHPLFRWDIEDDREVGRILSDGPALQRFDSCRIDAGSALVGPGRVSEAVAQHPLASCEARLDQRVDMIGAGRGKKDGLGGRPE